MRYWQRYCGGGWRRGETEPDGEAKNRKPEASFGGEGCKVRRRAARLEPPCGSQAMPERDSKHNGDKGRFLGRQLTPRREDRSR